MSGSLPSPTAYDAGLAETILYALGGGRSLVEVCDHDGMPDPADVLSWARSDPDFAARLQAARKASAELRLERLVARCERDPDEVRPTTFLQHLSHARLIFTANRLLLSIYDPERFGAIRGPRVSTYAADPPRSPPPATAEAPDDRTAFRAECAAHGVEDDLAALLIDIAEDDGLIEPVEPAGATSVLAYDRRPAAASASQPPRPSRRERRAMAAMARKQPPDRGANSRAPPP